MDFNLFNGIELEAAWKDYSRQNRQGTV